MDYRVILKPAAEKAIRKFDSKIRKRIIRKLEHLSLDPRPTNVTKLAGEENLWRVRVGDYRIVYEINDGQLVVLVVRVAHRRQVYQRM